MNIYIFKGMGKTEAEYRAQQQDMVARTVNAMMDVVKDAFADETVKTSPPSQGNQPA